MKNVKLTFPNEGTKTTFIVSVKTEEGPYRNAWFRFKFFIPDDWPETIPRVRAIDKIWHPNIQEVDENDPDSGNVHIAISPDEQNLSLSIIVQGIIFILNHPDLNAALNVIAADEYRKDYERFKNHVEELIDRYSYMKSSDDE